MFKFKVILFIIAIFCMSCSKTASIVVDYNIVPLPQEIVISDGIYFELNKSTTIVYQKENERLRKIAEILADDIFDNCGYKPDISSKTTHNSIVLDIDSSNAKKEGYILTVNKDGITITGGSEAGVFYGMQTLRKSIPASSHNTKIELPYVTIKDYPRFEYRGMMLDVARHFEPVDSIKKFIDIMAMHNMNKFHLHITDDQGWRVEIKKYPELISIGSKRDETVIGRNSGKYDGKPYGGYYTQDELKELVAYASDRFITIIPEVDLPGHQLAALTAYPDLGCTGGPYKVWSQWGVSEDVMCAGNDKSLAFLEDVLSEIIDIFPSEYIHIGGDECPKIRWEKCPKCQERIKREGFKTDKNHTAEAYLQSYVISHMQKFVESKGRKIIGWDEILEGGIDPNATVMSWRGIDGGMEAARLGNNVIMTPNQYLYFDYYQSTDTDAEPFAIGGYVPMSSVYGYEPIPESLAPTEAKNIIGVQANLWTEYIPTFNGVMYMVLPRMAALSETQWTNKELKNYENFLIRCAKMTDHYSRLNYNFAKHIFDVNAILTPNTEKGCLNISLNAFGEGYVYYTLDGSDPSKLSNKYISPIEINDNCTLKAVIIRDNSKSRIFTEKIVFSKSSMKPVILKQQPEEAYTFNGAIGLVDGLKGTDNFKTGRWLGFAGKDIDATIDLKQPTEISNVTISTNVVKGDWIMDACGITVKVSDDGETFKEVATQTIEPKKQTDPDGIFNYNLDFNKTTTRYVEIIIKNGNLPSWHTGAGKPAYIFVDEIQIN